MTVERVRGDLLAADCEALVNAVNTVGVMGKGIALAFKRRFPDNFAAYREACQRGVLRTGRVFVHERGEGETPRWTVNFPTKQHWRGSTRLEWIKSGLDDLVAAVRIREIRSLAIPRWAVGWAVSTRPWWRP